MWTEQARRRTGRGKDRKRNRRRIETEDGMERKRVTLAVLKDCLAISEEVAKDRDSEREDGLEAEMGWMNNWREVSDVRVQVSEGSVSVWLRTDLAGHHGSLPK